MNYNKYEDISYKNISDIKLKLFIKDIITNNFNNKVSIYMKYFPNSTKVSAEANSSRLINSDRFKVALQEIVDEERIGDVLGKGWLLQHLLKEYKEAPKHSDKLRALENIADIQNISNVKPTQMAIFQQIEHELSKVKSKEIKR